MFQGMFRKRGRPPEPPLQIGGYDIPSQEGSNQIPAHQLRDAPRQLPLPAVRGFEQSANMQQEQTGFSNAIVESSSLQQQQQQRDVDMLDSHNRRLSKNPRDIYLLFRCSQFRLCHSRNGLFVSFVPRPGVQASSACPPVSHS